MITSVYDIVTERPPNDTTMITFAEDPNVNDAWPNLRGIDWLTRPNQDVTSQTQVDHFNGDSYLFNLDISSVMLILPPSPNAQEYFNVQQKWEGYVIDVGTETFLAKLIPIIGEGPQVKAEIYLEEVDEEDLGLVKPGAVFYWSIGYLQKPSGTYKASLIRFRRLPPFTNSEIESARAEAHKLLDLFNEK